MSVQPSSAPPRVSVSVPPPSRTRPTIHPTYPPAASGMRAALAITALGVVFCDLGTSPL